MCASAACRGTASPSVTPQHLNDEDGVILRAMEWNSARIRHRDLAEHTCRNECANDHADDRRRVN